MINPFSLRYSDDNKKNTFNNGGNIGHGLKNVTFKQTFRKNLFDSTFVTLTYEACGH